MGFFSDILDGYNKKNKVRSLYRKDDYRFALKDGGMFAGPSKLLREANEYMNYCKLKEKQCVIAITGKKLSGKTTLAKTIMESNGIGYSRIFMKKIQDCENPLRLLETLLPYSGGVIIEEVDEITDSKLINTINMFLTKDVVHLSGNRKIDIRNMTIIVISSKDDPVLLTQNGLTIPMEYNREDFVKYYLYFCEESGHDFVDNNVKIDNRVVGTIGSIMNNNIALFRTWVYRLMDFAEKNRGISVNEDNVLEILFQTLDLETIKEVNTDK